MNNNFLLRLLSSVFLGPMVVFLIFLESYFFYLLLFITLVLSFFETLKLKKIITKILILSLLILFSYSSLQIYNQNDGRYIIIYILLLTWLSDIGGYIFGKFIGGKKIKIISPNKTYAGFVGSFLFVQFFGFYVRFLNTNFISQSLLNFYFLFICTLVVILGDMLFSYFKRKCEIKDFSNIIPGHGGLLDRIDGLILLTMFLYFFKL